jgi:hypothetical protein
MLNQDSEYSSLLAISVRFKQSTAHLGRSITQKQVASLSLFTVLSLTGISWMIGVAIAPQSAQAYTSAVNVSLSRQPGESYQSFVRRAEAVARAAAQRSFDRDILVTEVAVTITGQNDGAIAPILSLEVTRQSWRSRPDPQRWATYFPNTQSLLRFNQTTAEAETSDEATPDSEPVPQGTRPRVIELPGGGRRIITNPRRAPQQNNGANQRTGNPNAGQQNNAPNQRTGNPGAGQQNNAPNQAAPANVPQGPAPGQVITLPGGVRLIPNP